MSDTLMPEMDGFRFCREVKQDIQLQHVPFIFCQAENTDQKDEKLAQASASLMYMV
jgi:CheY-like chemotaxis protein